MQSRIVNLSLNNGARLPIRLTIARANGDWVVSAEATLMGRPIKVVATASEALIRSAMVRLGHAVAVEPSTGGWLDDIGKKIAAFARSKAVRSVLEGISTITKNPIIQNIASTYPPMAAALKLVAQGAESTASAQRLLTRARGNDTTALSAIRKITEKAKEGNPAAQVMHTVLATVNRSERPAQTAAPVQNMMNWFGPQTAPVSAGAAMETDVDVDALVRTLRATLG